MTGDGEGGRVRAVLGGPEYARLLTAVRAAVEARGEEARSVTLDGLDAHERRALANLAGWKIVPEGRIRLDLTRLDLAMRESQLGMSLSEVLAAIGGPIRNRRVEARRCREARERMWSLAAEACGAAERDDLARWLDSLRRSGALARAAKLAGRVPGDLLEAALRVALALPARGELLAVFAARQAGDPHALDAGTPLGGLLLRAAAAVSGVRDLPDSSAGRRELWRAVGIACDALSADVLVVGLRPEGDGLVPRQLRECAEAGEPRRLTLREVARSSLRVRTGGAVHVCENPAVVEAAADALGPRCAPLVCVEGVASTAALTLLRALSGGGARVLVHADLDWAGLRIAAQVLGEAGGNPWRMTAGDYRAALTASPHGPPLGGRRSTAAWDADLMPAMVEGGRAVLEEQVIDVLLRDLARSEP